MTMLRAIIADDEYWAVRRLEAELGAIGDVRLVATARDGAEAARLIAKHAPDLVMLDIQMPELSGFDLARRIATQADPPDVIFVTAFEEHATAAFAVNAADYLLKPIERGRLAKAIDRVRDRRAARSMAARACDLEGLLDVVQEDRRRTAPPRYLRDIWIRQAGRLLRIDIDEVDWFAADRDYAIVHVGADAHLLRRSLSRLAKSVDPGDFMRIHRSAIVRKSFVVSVERRNGRASAAVLANGARVPIGPTYASRVSKLLRR